MVRIAAAIVTTSAMHQQEREALLQAHLQRAVTEAAQAAASLKEREGPALKEVRRTATVVTDINTY